MRTPLAAAIAVAMAAGSACNRPPALPPIVYKTPPPDAGSGAGNIPPPKPVNQEESLAAIQKAMNELDEAVQGCWAVVATERFDVEGDLTATIDIGATPDKTRATLVVDTTRNGKLAACVVKVLEAYPWAPPLRGQTIQLPFRVRHPTDGQNVIDRALVSAVGQGDARLSVLLDDNNTGADGASMIQVQLAAGASTGMRRADRAELWYFASAATIVGPTPKQVQQVAAGDFATVEAGGVRELRAPDGGRLDAVLILVPGGREGAARAGALPTPEASGGKIGAHVWHGGRDAKTYPRGPGKVTIVVEKFAPAAGSLLDFPAGMAIPEHVHAKETELMYVLSGTGTLTVKGQPLAVTATSVVQVPPNTPHAFTATTDFRAVQIYTPAGPEQRFKKP
jgi:quercetin dioxygenase-like cupin family protein